MFGAASHRSGFIAEALVIFPSLLKSVRKRLFHCGAGMLPLQFFQVARHLGRDLIKFLATISGVQSRFEAQEVEFLAISELPARFEIVLQSCVHIRLVLVHYVFLTPAPRRVRCLFWSKGIALRSHLSHESLDLAHVFIRQAKVASAHHSFRLACIAGADDCSCDGGVVQRPGDRDLSG